MGYMTYIRYAPRAKFTDMNTYIHKPLILEYGQVPQPQHTALTPHTAEYLFDF